MPDSISIFRIQVHKRKKRGLYARAFCVFSLSDLGSFVFAANLLLNLPVRERVLMSATWTLPGAFDRIGAAFMKHFDYQVAMQTHCRMAMHQFFLWSFTRYSHDY
jgi:hypothetical protein